MTKTAHTPGPWKWNEYHDDLRPIWHCEMSQGCGYLDWDDKDRIQANARLIAAAPDLLEALEMMLADPDAIENVNFAKAMIAKAKGGAA